MMSDFSRWAHDYHGTPEHPFRDALQVICGKEPPPYVRGYSVRDMTDAEYGMLTSWVLNDGLNRAIDWTTGIGVIEAAEHIVKEAVSNANIPPREYWEPEPEPDTDVNFAPPTLPPPEDDEAALDADDGKEE